MKFKLEIDCDNFAFTDAPATEISRILRDTAQRVQRDGAGAFTREKLRDLNGNTVGFFEAVD